MFFGKKKEKRKVISISGKQLCDLLGKSVSLLEKEVNEHYYSFGPEIMFEYNGNVHFAGVTYDKKRAKAEKLVSFSDELMTAYVDKQPFATIEELHDNATIDEKILADIVDGILVTPEYGELL